MPLCPRFARTASTISATLSPAGITSSMRETRSGCGEPTTRTPSDGAITSPLSPSGKGNVAEEPVNAAPERAAVIPLDSAFGGASDMQDKPRLHDNSDMAREAALG